MKKIAVISVVSFLCSSLVYAQNGFYFGAGIGGGVSSGFSQPFLNGPNLGAQIFSPEYLVKAGRYSGNWQLEVGLGYLTTGIVFSYDPDPAGFLYGSYRDGNPYEKITDRHIILPISVSYKIKLGKKFSLSPGGGLVVVYNNSTEIQYSGAEPLGGSGDNINHYNNVTAALLLSLEAGYILNSKWSVTAGPSMQKTPYAAYPNGIYDYAYLFNAGVKYYLQKKKVK